MEKNKIYKMRKKGGNKKRVVPGRGCSCTHEIWEHPRAHALECPFLRRRHLSKNILYN
jgi:hypothetical protein